MSVLIIAEHNNQVIKPSTFSTLTAAKKFDQPIFVLVAGHQCHAVAETLSKIEGIEAVWLADHLCYEHFLAESLAPLIAHCAETVTYLMAPATSFGKNLLPRVAAQWGVSPITDIIDILGEKTYRRPIYAGNAIATVFSSDKKQVITVRTTAFSSTIVVNDQAVPIQKIEYFVDNSQSYWVSEERHGDTSRPELSAAEIVISGGRGLQNKENFDRLQNIADRLGAAIGASRAAVDAGLAPNDYQVGQTGQVVAPKLYIAVGISGAIQHIAGMRNSQTIVAINKDPEAPIFQIADYGLVADLNEVLSEWETAIC